MFERSPVVILIRETLSHHERTTANAANGADNDVNGIKQHWHEAPIECGKEAKRRAHEYNGAEYYQLL